MLLGRETPELPAEVIFVEIGVLRDFATDRELSEPLDLCTATMAVLGGYLTRKHDRPPGYKMIWVGNSRLTIMAQACESRNRVAAVEPRQQLHSDKTCDYGEACDSALPLAGRPSRRTAARSETRRKGHAARNPENAGTGEEDARRGDRPASRGSPSASRGLPLRRTNACGKGLNRRSARIILRSMNKTGDPHRWRKKN